MVTMISAWEKLECLTVVVNVLKNNLKQDDAIRKK